MFVLRIQVIQKCRWAISKNIKPASFGNNYCCFYSYPSKHGFKQKWDGAVYKICLSIQYTEYFFLSVHALCNTISNEWMNHRFIFSLSNLCLLDIKFLPNFSELKKKIMMDNLENGDTVNYLNWSSLFNIYLLIINYVYILVYIL